MRGWGRTAAEWNLRIYKSLLYVAAPFPLSSRRVLHPSTDSLTASLLVQSQLQRYGSEFVRLAPYIIGPQSLHPTAGRRPRSDSYMEHPLSDFGLVRGAWIQAAGFLTKKARRI